VGVQDFGDAGLVIRLRVIITAACLLAAVGLYVALNWEAEPSYKGRRLTEWMDDTMVAPGTKPRATDREWEEAIKQMGSKAAPLLVKWLENRPGVAARAVFAIRDAAPLSLRYSRMMLWLARTVEPAPRSDFRTFYAERALLLLHKDALPALPVLMRMFRSTERWSGAYRAEGVLASLGTAAFPEVLKCASDPKFKNMESWVRVVGRMRDLGPAATQVVPILCRLLKKDVNLRSACIYALGDLGAMPELAVPALVGELTNALQVPDVFLSRKSAEALGKFNMQAGEAVPILCVALKSPDGITTEEAARALGRIGAKGDIAVPALSDYMRNTRHRKYAVEGLAAYGAEAREAVPLIEDALSDGDHDTRELAKAALQRINSKRVNGL
jgi:hypothetical protein